MENKTTQGTAAAQEAAAPTDQTVATATTSTETGNTATVATTFAKKMPPKKRVSAAIKEPKEPKRLTGSLVYIALVSYNHWRNFVNAIINGENKDEKMIATFRKDETAIEGTKWGGYIATPAKNVEEVLSKLNDWTAINNSKPIYDGKSVVTNQEDFQAIEMWSILEHFQTVESKPRAERKPKASTAVEATTEATTSEVETAEVTAEVETTEVTTEVETTETSEVVA